MKVAVVGGGINGVMSAAALAEVGYEVVLFEKHTLMSATSSASTKLLHGGLRYLEYGEFRLVKEALREREWWIANAPHLAHSIELILPVYRDSRRSTLKLKLGLLLYDALSGKRNLGKHSWRLKDELSYLAPKLRTEGLIGGFTFFDGQMDDYRLGMWAVQRARDLGVSIYEHTEIKQLSPNGCISVQGEWRQYDFIINAAGPWSRQLLQSSRLESHYALDLVRGSHIVVDKAQDRGFFLQVPKDSRICFVLPYQGKTLIGTTEARQALNQPITCHDDEVSYLLDVYNYYFQADLKQQDVSERFAGVRPLIYSESNPGAASREYAFEKNGRLLTVFGGKWTTSRALAIKVAKRIKEMERHGH